MLDPKNWFAVQLKPNGLTLAERNLARQGFTHFCPKRHENHRSGGRFVSKTTPLFPGYVFVQFDPAATAWRAVNSTRGVTRLIGDGRGVPVPLPEAFMAALIDRCDASGIFQNNQAFEEGSDVRIIAGPFAQSIAQIEKSDANGRLSVLLEIMGQTVRAHIPSGSVEKIKTTAAR